MLRKLSLTTALIATLALPTDALAGPHGAGRSHDHGMPHGAGGSRDHGMPHGYGRYGIHRGYDYGGYAGYAGYGYPGYGYPGGWYSGGSCSSWDPYYRQWVRWVC